MYSKFIKPIRRNRRSCFDIKIKNKIHAYITYNKIAKKKFFLILQQLRSNLIILENK